MLTGRLPAPGFGDAAPACLPGRKVAALAAVREQILAGDLAVARPQLRRIGATLSEQDASEATLLVEVLVLREEPSAANRRSLREALRDPTSASSQVCAHLELARAELIAGLIPEARTSLLRAVRGIDPKRLPEDLASSHRHLQAEAFMLSERADQAEPLYEANLAASSEKLAAAAALRLAILRPQDEEPASEGEPEVGPEERARRHYRRVKQHFDAARVAHLDVDVWAALLGELALRADLADAAHIWFSLAQERAGEDSPEAIRRADALARADRPDEARLILLHLAERHGGDAIGTLARVRLVDLGLSEEDEVVRRQHLHAASRHLHPRIAAHALDVLAHHLLEADDLDAALAARARLLREAVAPDLIPHAERDLTALLARVGGPDVDCIDVLRRVGGSRDVLISHAPDPAPILRLGDCYLEFSMPEAALSVYRSASRVFGTELTRQLPMRLARASFLSGDWAAVEAAVRSALASAARPDRARWLLLRGRLKSSTGDLASAGRSLLESLSAPGLPAHERREAVVELARVAAAGAGPDGWQVQAAAALEQDSLWPEESLHLRGELALHLADAGRPGEAGVLERYRMAAEWLSPGVMRERAAFRIGGRDDAPASGRSKYWTRIGDVDQGVARVADRLGVAR